MLSYNNMETREKFLNIKSIGTVRYLAAKARDPEYCEEILRLLYDEDPHVSRNAAWVMTHFSKKLKEALRFRQSEFIDIIMKTDNSGLKRLLLNIVEHQGVREEDLRTDFLDYCLGHMLAVEEPPGIQSLCMKLSFAQCLFYPELLHEFRETLLIMQNGYAVSLVGLRKKMLKKATDILDNPQKKSKKSKTKTKSKSKTKPKAKKS